MSPPKSKKRRIDPHTETNGTSSVTTDQISQELQEAQEPQDVIMSESKPQRFETLQLHAGYVLSSVAH
jgi:hypothetical protein